MPFSRWLQDVAVFCFSVMAPYACSAEAVSLLQDNTFASHRSALVQIGANAAPSDTGLQRAPSLFAGRSGNSLFAPSPDRIELASAAMPIGLNSSAVQRLRHIIGQAESRRNGYDAVQHGATRRPADRPTNMTIGEIYQWIDDTPGQPHAIGRYQFIPATLRRLVNELGLPPSTRFSPHVQDQLADILLAEAGFHAANRGDMGRHEFMNNLAKIWAGLPNSTGRSHYHGYAGNAASISWASFDAQMSEIFPG